MSAVLPSSLNVSAAERPIAPMPTLAADDVGNALERLALSRARLRAAMMPVPAEPRAHALGEGLGTLASSLFERVKAIPGAAALIDTIQTWWAQHPLRTAGIVAIEASRELAAPIARRNPLALVLGSAVVGALLALTRPWRWILKPALFAGLMPAIAARAIRELPIDSWLKLFASIGTPGRTRTSQSPQPPRATGTTNPPL